MHPLPPLLLALVLLLAGCTTAPNDARDPDDLREGSEDGGDLQGSTTTTMAPPVCPGHWHAQFAFYLNNTSVPLDHPDFTRPSKVHLHTDTGDLLHYHPGATPTCIPVSSALGWLGMTIDDDWTLDARHGNLSGEHAINDTQRLHVWVQPWGQDWTQTRYDDWRGEQLPDGARMLFSLGTPSEDDLAWQRSQVDPIPEPYAPRDN